MFNITEKPNKEVDMQNTKADYKIFSGQYFKDNPGKVLGRILTHNPNTGKELTNRFGKPQSEIWGDLENALAGIKVMSANRFEHLYEMTLGEKVVKEKKVSKIKKAIEKTKNDNSRISGTPVCSSEMQCLDETIKKYNPGITDEEIRVWVTFQVNDGLFDEDVISDNAWGRFYVEKPDYNKWYSQGLVAFDGIKYIPSVIYYAGNIYKAIEVLKRNKSSVIAKVSESGYENQLKELEAVKPTQLVIGSDESVKLRLSPFDKIWEKVKIKTLATGVEVAERHDTILKVFAYEYLHKLPRNEITFEGKYSTATEINNHWLQKRRFANDTLESEKATIKRNTAIIGNHLFDRFMIEYLTDEDKARIAHLWNSESNHFKDVDYSRIPIGFNISRKFKGGTLEIRAAQREGVGFLNYRGTGIVAYDVGVGKTMTSILGVADGFSKGLFKRPLVVVPQKVIKKWIAEMIGVYAEKDIKKGKKVLFKKGDLISEGILPGTKINDYDNLGVKVIDRAVDEFGIAYTVDEYSVTIVTYEGLMKIGFNGDTEDVLVQRIKEMLSQGESGRTKAIIEQQAEDWVDKAILQTKVDIEEMGIDAIFVDEGHNFRNLFMEAKGDVGADGEREKKHFYSGQGGTPSSRAIKLFMLNSYIQSKHNDRNTFALTATPFTNRATEIYSMMAMYDAKGLKEFGVFNLAQFCSKFIDETFESAWTPAGTFDIKPVIRGYNNLQALQSMIFRTINYKTGEDANIPRPEKVVIPLYNDDKGIPLEKDYVVDSRLVPSPKQEEWLEEIRMFASSKPLVRRESKVAMYYPEDKKGDVPGQLLIALNATRAVTFSPYILRFKGEYVYDIGNVTPKQFIQDSPKLNYVCECIRSVKQYHEAEGTPVSGQIIYSDRGLELFGHIKKYLVEDVGFAENEIEEFHAGVSKKKREKIKEDFLANKVKVVIGTSTMREGVDLQKYGTVIYNCYLDWNPTDHHQLSGRIWRYGNKFSHVRIVVPLIENSSDIFTWQKLSEKMSRLNTIWTRSDKSKLFEESELNAEELKKGLINDPEELARIEVDEQKAEIVGQFNLIKGELSILKEVEPIKDEYLKLKQEIEDIAYEAVNNPKDLNYYYDESVLEALVEMDIEREYKKILAVKKYAAIKPYSVKNEYLMKVGRYIKVRDRVHRLDYNVLRKYSLDLSDDFADVINHLEGIVEEFKSKVEAIGSDENFAKVLARVVEEKEQMEMNRRPVGERINEFKRLNYLLQCKFGVHACDIYGRVEEAESGKSVKVIEQPKTEFVTAPDQYRMSKRLKLFMPKFQQTIVKSIIAGEEGEGYIKDTLNPLEKQVADIPKLYETEGANLGDKVIHAHFFLGGSDWYVAEWDGNDTVFGYAILNGDNFNAEWGYISLAELQSVVQNRIAKVELDFYWKPKKFLEIFPSEKTDEDSLQEAAEALEVAIEFATGKDKKSLQEALEALQVALEFV